MPTSLDAADLHSPVDLWRRAKLGTDDSVGPSRSYLSKHENNHGNDASRRAAGSCQAILRRRSHDSVVTVSSDSTPSPLVLLDQLIELYRAHQLIEGSAGVDATDLVTS
eukprot:scaffold870_cov268-Pinguiococcus_pyrenoidosus.AAC.71